MISSIPVNSLVGFQLLDVVLILYYFTVESLESTLEAFFSYVKILKLHLGHSSLVSQPSNVLLEL